MIFNGLDADESGGENLQQVWPNRCIGGFIPADPILLVIRICGLNQSRNVLLGVSVLKLQIWHLIILIVFWGI